MALGQIMVSRETSSQAGLVVVVIAAVEPCREGSLAHDGEDSVPSQPLLSCI